MNRYVMIVVTAVLLQFSAYGATSVSQYGITWTFDGDYETGQFANGDWWVAGPVTIVSVDPAPASGRHGSMLNPPIGKNAFDDRGGAWDASLAAVFPLTLQPVQSLVSTISNPETTDCLRYGEHPGWTTYDGGCHYTGSMKTQAILTCVGQAATGYFRPSYADTGYKTLYALEDVQWDRLPMLPPPASAPDAAKVLRNFERPWIDHYGSWIIEHTYAVMNMYGYGREVGNIVSEGAQYVLLDTEAAETLAIRLIQLGIDNYGVLKNGGGWPPDGGHMNGRKWPILFAGSMLDDPDMKNVGSDFNGTVKFGEDGQTYYGQPTTEYPSGKPLWGTDCGGSFTGNYVYDGGTGCWDLASGASGSKDCRDPDGIYEPCSYRICCTSLTWVGQALSALILGFKDLWNHDALFDYVDRWVAEEGNYGGRDWDGFIEDMWAAYRDDLPSSISRPGMTGIAPDFKNGNIYTITGVRAVPGKRGSGIYLSVPEGAQAVGRIVILK